MAGRPRKTLQERRRQGDTGQRGARRFAEAVEAAYEPRRGCPPFPSALEFSAACKSRHPDPEIRKIEDAVMVERLRLAKEHWLYLAKELETEGKLAMLDGGMLTAVTLNFAMMVEAARDGESAIFARLHSQYIASADRMGLNERARASLPGSPKHTDEVETALCGGLPAEDSDPASVQ